MTDAILYNLKRERLWVALSNLGIPLHHLEISTFTTNDSRGWNDKALGVRLTHLPTGLRVDYQHGRTQIESLQIATALLVYGLRKARDIPWRNSE